MSWLPLRRTRFFVLLLLCAFLRGGAADEKPIVEAAPKLISINGKNYKLYWVKGGSYGAGQNYTPTGRADVAYIWDGKTVWSVDPLHGRLLSTLKSQYAPLAVSPDLLRALVATRSGPALMDVATQKIGDVFDGFEEFHRWQFSPNGKFVYPLAHHNGAQKYRYIEVENNRVVEFPLWWRDSTRELFLAGVSSPDGKYLMVFSMAQETSFSFTLKSEGAVEGQRVTSLFSNKILRVIADDSQSVTIRPSALSIEQVFERREGKILCLLSHNDNKNYNYESSLSLVDSTTLKVTQEVSIPRDNRIFWAGFTPDGKDIYMLDDLEGLSIYDAETLKPVANIKAGRRANAYSIGATFSDDGKFAFLAQPYAGTVDIIDVKTRKIVSTVKVGEGVAGVLPIGDECFAISTKLPYE